MERINWIEFRECVPAKSNGDCAPAAQPVERESVPLNHHALRRGPGLSEI
jgi:hypothetical protein